MDKQTKEVYGKAEDQGESFCSPPIHPVALVMSFQKRGAERHPSHPTRNTEVLNRIPHIWEYDIVDEGLASR